MLRQLHITGLGVIDELDLEPDAGLTVLTGETGAGKTMIAAGLSLALGARGSAQVVRAGAASAKVQARFDAPAGATEWAEDGEVILARTISGDGRGAARIGGQLTTASALAELGATLVEIHGQHQSLRLLDTATQTNFLDRFAGAAHVRTVDAYREEYAALLAARRELAALTEAARDRERAIDLLGYQVREIEAVAPDAGETDALRREEARLGHAERLREVAGEVGGSFGADGGVADLVSGGAAGLEAIRALDPQAGVFADRAAALAAEASDLAQEVRAYGESIAEDPGRLAAVRDRIAALKALQRKYGADDDEVLAFLDRTRDELGELESAGERLAEIQAIHDRAASAVAASAETIHATRAQSAPALSDALSAHVGDLGMPGATIRMVVEETLEPGPLGRDRVEIRFAGAASQPLLPIAKAASGGELSRVMLACRSVMADLDDVPTLVFDEIDAGIGGEAGLAVGRRLARLARSRQVLVVTHLPQIACFADRHVRVRKDDGTASAAELDPEQRLRELSRMLAGMERSEHALSHAQELLEVATRARAEAS